jgi:hypothetical protein
VQREQQENQGGVTGVNENCVDKIMDFLENTLKIEDTKSIQIEKAYRLGKCKNGPTKPFHKLPLMNSLSPTIYAVFPFFRSFNMIGTSFFLRSTISRG